MRLRDVVLSSPEFPRSSWVLMLLCSVFALAVCTASASLILEMPRTAKALACISFLFSVLCLGFVVSLFWHLLSSKKFAGTGPYALARLRANSPEFDNVVTALLEDVESLRTKEAEDLARRVSDLREDIGIHLLQLYMAMRSQFVLIVLSAISSIILSFAALYLGCTTLLPSAVSLSPDFLAAMSANGAGERLLNAVYCSTLTFSTIGCGPTGHSVLKLVTILEVLFSLATLSFTMGVTLSFYQNMPMFSEDNIVRQVRLEALTRLRTQRIRA